MFAASARHTNAGIAARQGLPIAALADHSRLIREQQRRAREEVRARLAAERQQRDWLASQPKALSPAQAILAEIAAQHGFTVDVLRGKSRTRAVVAARHHAIYEIRRRCRDVSTTVIGRLMGGRDHTSVMHAIRNWPAKAAVLGIECLPIADGQPGQHEPLIFGGQDNG